MAYPTPSDQTAVPWLENGDRLTCHEFERRLTKDW